MHFSLIILVAAVFVGLVKGGLGPVAGALIVPLLSTSMPVTRAVGLTLPLLLVGDWIALPVYWRKWDAQELRLLVPGGVVGVATGLVLLTTLSDDMLRRVLGVFTLSVAGYKLVSDSLTTLRYQPRRWHGVLAGWGSGFGSALANVGAPPITAYLLLRRLTPTFFIGTTVIFFLVMNALKFPLYLATDVIKMDQVIDILWALPLIPLGVWGGKKFVEWIDPKKFERLMLVALIGTGIALLV
jgi:uncharacterized membrane protein YfcA